MMCVFFLSCRSYGAVMCPDMFQLRVWKIQYLLCSEGVCVCVRVCVSLVHSPSTVQFLSTVVSRKYAPPFCNLSLSTERRGGLYAGCTNFSRDYALPFDKA